MSCRYLFARLLTIHQISHSITKIYYSKFNTEKYLIDLSLEERSNLILFIRNEYNT